MRLPNIHIVQAISGAILFLAGAGGSILDSDRLVNYAAVTIELALLFLLIQALKKRDTKYIYTMIGSMICIAFISIMISNIVIKLKMIP